MRLFPEANTPTGSLIWWWGTPHASSNMWIGTRSIEGESFMVTIDSDAPNKSALALLLVSMTKEGTKTLAGAMTVPWNKVCLKAEWKREEVLAISCAQSTPANHWMLILFSSVCIMKLMILWWSTNFHQSTMCMPIITKSNNLWLSMPSQAQDLTAEISYDDWLCWTFQKNLTTLLDILPLAGKGSQNHQCTSWCMACLVLCCLHLLSWWRREWF